MGLQPARRGLSHLLSIWGNAHIPQGPPRW